jgi:hypothetical protein
VVQVVENGDVTGIVDVALGVEAGQAAFGKQ